MSEITCHSGLSEAEKKKLFWASFLALAAAAYGFVFRVIDLMGGALGEDLKLSQQQFGELFGASLWPVAITMIIFSMAVEKVGYKRSMFIAFALQVASVLISFTSTDYTTLYIASIAGGLGHGVIEAVINPVCAAIYKDDKSKMLNILHASWPAGIVFGGTVILLTGTASWQLHFGFMLLPVLAYGLMFIGSKFPKSENEKAHVPYKEMLGEFGGSGFFLAATLICYELTRQICGNIDNLMIYSLSFGLIAALAFGLWVKSAGRLMFFMVCLLMIPLATTELGTDAWIQSLMRPVLGANAGWAIVASAGIMMMLRFNAGLLLKKMSPPAVLLLSCGFSAAGLYILSRADGAAIFLAFVCYAIGQTFLWPTMLGFVSERFPKGGAIALNSITAIGLLALGIIGTPFLGLVQDSKSAEGLKSTYPAIHSQAAERKGFFGVEVQTVNMDKLRAKITPFARENELKQAAKKEMKIFQREAKFIAQKKEKELQALRKSYDYEQAVATLDKIESVQALKAEPGYKAEEAKIRKSIQASKRSALSVAAMMPAFMALCFLGIMLYFRAKGGYKAVHLTEEENEVES